MWHTKDIEETRRNLRTNLEIGLTEEEAKERLEKNGPNKLQDKKKESIIIKFIKQFNDFMIIILIIASGISAVMAYLEGSGDYFDSIIIIAIVVFNAIMGLVQEAKAEKSLEALKKMSSPVAKVKRNGKITNILSEEVVVGDIIILEAGNYVPADCRLIKTSNLKVEESALTGETVPVLKDANIILKQEVTLGDVVNMAYATTIVVGGHRRGNCNRNRNVNKSGENCKNDYTRRSSRNTNTEKIRGSRKNIRNSVFTYMSCNICNRNIQENPTSRNVPYISWTCSSSNTRGITSNCYNYAINRSN